MNQYDTNYKVIIDKNTRSQAEYDHLFSIKDGILKITSEVSAIGNQAFFFDESIETVIIPDTVECIGDYAFAHCKRLKNVYLGKNTRTIHLKAFYFCSKLENIYGTESLTHIADSAFYGDENLTSFHFGPELKMIGNDCFSLSTNNNEIYSNPQLGLKSITLPQSLDVLGQRTFKNQVHLLNADIKGNLYELAIELFSGCYRLSKVLIPSSVQKIGNSCFSHCALSAIDIPKGLLFIGNNAFSDNKQLERIELPSSVTSIGGDAFSGCPKLVIEAPKGSYAASYAIDIDKYDFQTQGNTKPLDSMDGYEFEHYIAELLKREGFINVKQTALSNDYGVDITAEKYNVKFAFQCKCYSNPIGNKAVQEVYSGMHFYRANVGVVVTNNTFTRSAVKQAEASGIVLWDGKFVKKLDANIINC